LPALHETSQLVALAQWTPQSPRPQFFVHASPALHSVSPVDTQAGISTEPAMTRNEAAAIRRASIEFLFRRAQVAAVHHEADPSLESDSSARPSRS
jgi:hypothetical protein